jgi:hypothetical protein
MSFCMGAQLSLFVMIASNDSFAVISNGWERCSFASRLRLVFGYERGIIPGVLPSTPLGPHFVRSNLLPANLSNLKGPNQILTIPIYL